GNRRGGDGLALALRVGEPAEEVGLVEAVHALRPGVAAVRLHGLEGPLGVGHYQHATDVPVAAPRRVLAAPPADRAVAEVGRVAAALGVVAPRADQPRDAAGIDVGQALAGVEGGVRRVAEAVRAPVVAGAPHAPAVLIDPRGAVRVRGGLVYPVAL